MPVYVAPYVVSDYGTGAVMGVPAHDKRDFEFFHVNKVADELKFVVEPSIKEVDAQPDHSTPFTAQGVLTALSGPYAGMKSKQAGKAILKDALEAGFGRSVTKVKLCIDRHAQVTHREL